MLTCEHTYITNGNSSNMIFRPDFHGTVVFCQSNLSPRFKLDMARNSNLFSSVKGILVSGLMRPMDYIWHCLIWV